MLLSTLALLNTFNSEVTTGAQMSDVVYDLVRGSVLPVVFFKLLVSDVCRNVALTASGGNVFQL